MIYETTSIADEKVLWLEKPGYPVGRYIALKDRQGTIYVANRRDMIHATAQLAWDELVKVEWQDVGFYFPKTRNYLSKYMPQECSGHKLYQRLVNVINQLTATKGK